jgi:Pathogenicity locus
MKKLSDLRNVGTATLGDLRLLQIQTVEELARQDPTKLFRELERLTQKRQDPCVWDVFAAIIHEAATGEPTNWWKWTGIPKQLGKLGFDCVGFTPKFSSSLVPCLSAMVTRSGQKFWGASLSNSQPSKLFGYKRKALQKTGAFERDGKTTES